MAKRIAISDLRDGLVTIIANDKEFIAGRESNENPQVVEMVTWHRGSVEMAEAVLDALNGYSVTFDIFVNPPR